MKEYHVGDTIRVRPSFLPHTADGGLPPKLPAQVIYVHPQGRFITVAFTVDQFNGVRECYFPEELEESQ